MPRDTQPRKAAPRKPGQSAPEQATKHVTPHVRHEVAEQVHRRLVDLKIDAAKHSVRKPVKNKT